MRALKRGSLTWNIRINSIAPSVTDSAMTRFIPTVIPDCERVGIPVSTPEDVAKAIALLAVDEKYNGHTISVDGQAYRELESGFERHNKDLMGTHTEHAMTKEQLDVMSRWLRPFRRASANRCRWYRSVGCDVVKVVPAYHHSICGPSCDRFLPISTFELSFKLEVEGGWKR
jgi:hypothetical protein